jgi:hypothetical protein
MLWWVKGLAQVIHKSIASPQVEGNTFKLLERAIQKYLEFLKKLRCTKFESEKGEWGLITQDHIVKSI